MENLGYEQEPSVGKSVGFLSAWATPGAAKSSTAGNPESAAKGVVAWSPRHELSGFFITMCFGVMLFFQNWEIHHVWNPFGICYLFGDFWGLGTFDFTLQKNGHSQRLNLRPLMSKTVDFASKVTNIEDLIPSPFVDGLRGAV